MTGDEHQAEAEKYLEWAYGQGTDTSSAMLYLEFAKVHAILATVHNPQVVRGIKGRDVA